jgi:hypothetical protein
VTTRDDILQGVRTWFKTAITGLTDAQIIPHDSKGPRPPLPYLTVKVVTADAPDGVDESGHFDVGPGDSEWRAKGERAAVVDVQGHDTTGTTTAAGWLEDAAIRLQRPDVQAVLDTAGLSIVNRGTVLDVSALLDTEIERRHLRSFEVRYTLRDTGPGLPEAVVVEVDPIVLERYDNHPDPLIIDVTVDPF